MGGRDPVIGGPGSQEREPYGKAPDGGRVDPNNPEHLRFLWTRRAELFDYLHPGQIADADARDLLAKLAATYPAWKELARVPVLKIESMDHFKEVYGDFDPNETVPPASLGMTMNEFIGVQRAPASSDGNGESESG
jgi:hypothetical protein